MANHTQTQIDFESGTRAGRLRMVENVSIPRCPKGTPKREQASAAIAKSLLKMIESFDGRCYASEAWLAEKLEVSERTVRRAVARLSRLSLICVQRKSNRFGTVTNNYQLVWSEIALLQPKNTADQQDIGTIQQDTVSSWSSDQQDIGTDQQDIRTDQEDTVSSNPPYPPYPPSSSREDPAMTTATKLLEKHLSDPSTVARLVSHHVDEIPDVVLEFEHSRQRCGLDPGAIAYRLSTGKWPADGVATADAIRSAAVAKQHRREAESRDQRAVEIDAGQSQCLELDFGAVLDSMSLDDQVELALLVDPGIVDGPFGLRRRPQTHRATMLEIIAAASKVPL